MCGRFGTNFTTPQLVKTFDLSNRPKVNISYNVAPSQMILAVTKKSPNKGILMNWQFVSNWQKPPIAKFKPINARDDKLEGVFFRHAFYNNRCLIPASFFYEWKRAVIDGKEEKIPYLIKLKKEILFGMAGVYEIHTDAEGKDHYYCAIVTTGANSLMKPIHNRMPVIIHKNDQQKWLCGEISEAKQLLKPFDPESMIAYRISKSVNDPGNNNSKLTRKIID